MDYAADMIPVDYGIPKDDPELNELIDLLHRLQANRPRSCGVLDASKPPTFNRPSVCTVTRKGVKSPLFGATTVDKEDQAHRGVFVVEPRHEVLFAKQIDIDPAKLDEWKPSVAPLLED